MALGLGVAQCAPAGSGEDPGALNNAAQELFAEGRYAEGIPLARRALQIYERMDPNHPWTAVALSTLGVLYQAQGRYDDAQPLLERALQIIASALPASDPRVSSALNNLGLLHSDEEHYKEAEELFKQAIKLDEEQRPGTASLAMSLNNLALLYRRSKRFTEAEPLYLKALALDQAAYGTEHADVALAYNNLGSLYQDLGRTGEAMSNYQKSLDLRARLLGVDHPYVSQTLNNMADLSFDKGDWAKAAQYWQQSTGLLVIRSQREGDTLGEVVTSRGASDAERAGWQFVGLIKAAFRAAPNDSQKAEAAFEAAQWVENSSAAASLTQMAARSAPKDPKLAAIVRKRQDLLDEWHARDGVRTQFASVPPSQRDQMTEAGNLRRLAAIDVAVASIDRELAGTFPDYDAFATPSALSVADVQGQLHDDEALVLFLDTNDWKLTTPETFVWVVTKNDFKWVRSELGSMALDQAVATLRCGLDYAGAWDVENSECPKLTGVTYTQKDFEANKPLPFDTNRAHALYASLFGQIEKYIKDKSLLLVPAGPLTQLPFHVLVTAPAPADAPPSKVAWLLRSNAVTVLPAVSSLKALRHNAKPSRAAKPFLGVGNPLLDGEGEIDAKDRQAAIDNKSCAALVQSQVANLRGRHGVGAVANNGGLADIAQLKKAPPLPETAEELCTVAKAQGAGAGDVLLGARATEKAIKQMSASRALADYRTIEFSTHGAVSGEVSGSNEPGLVLTPPGKASNTDDGYLTASETAALKLDADWVILSACNTAAGGPGNTEALSGLARAFFYAGTRSLLVSHWYVSSAATVSLIGGVFRELAADPGLARAQALRRSMLTLADRDLPPAQWAPFVVVGEGAAVGWQTSSP